MVQFRQLSNGVWIDHLDYQSADGETAGGWLSSLGEDGGSYYLGEDGRLLTGWQRIDGEWYYFRENGERVVGWLELDGDQYYLDAFKGDGGAMATGWLRYFPQTYYLDADGRMVTGDREIDGTWYSFRDDGAHCIPSKEVRPMNKRAMTTLLCLLLPALCVGLLTVTAMADGRDVASGTCGEGRKRRSRTDP